MIKAKVYTELISVRRKIGGSTLKGYFVAGHLKDSFVDGASV